jgi:predicted MFS family arabinose efflux permease
MTVQVQTTKLQMLPDERRATAALTGIYATRILGLFLLLPVLDLYVRALPGGSQWLAGFAVGAYALAQGLLQIPAGRLSDRIGRQPVIAGGLVLFILGSLVGMFTHSIAGVILARLLQGAGAISSAVTALVADVTRPQVRTRAMAIIGISIGVCFIISLLAGPALEGAFGVNGIFACMAVLGVASLGALYWVPEPASAQRTVRDSALTPALWRTPLLLTYVGIFSVHFSLTAAFVAVPQILKDSLHLNVATHWRVYALVFMLSLLLTVPLLRVFEKSKNPRRITQLGVLLLAASMLWMFVFARGASGLYMGLTVFFGAFNFLEAQLPARVSLVADPTSRGAAMGVFATAQFIGAGVGATLAGLLLDAGLAIGNVFAAGAVVAMIWLACLLFLYERDV